ncbi:hypothetical protein KP79_PYT23802 [Mizuhopecten yessoensis]|uniref:Mutator-like transposase domain-containing protein n=1 Tax=Mizuhopecten yessoensis TaxID=6573 RepID=A0A210PEU7_MIZYE|nr:hypothetical protein KP79_PYT23802 [Mizuhopecten yessoensis]
MWDVKSLADPAHLGQAQFRKCMRAHFSTDMFPGMKTREGKIGAQMVLSRDIKARCSLVCKELTKDCSGQTKTMREKLPLVLDATHRCYSGDFSRCKRYSFVCNGGTSSGTWWNRAILLSKYKLYSLNMNEKHKHLILEILKMKLTDEYVTAMSLGADNTTCGLEKQDLINAEMDGRYSEFSEERVFEKHIQSRNSEVYHMER